MTEASAEIWDTAEQAVNMLNTSVKNSQVVDLESGNGMLRQLSLPGIGIQNLLLDTLPADDLDHLHKFLLPFEMKKSMVLQDVGARSEYVYFAESGVISNIVRPGIDGAVEISMVGRTGLVGIATVLGNERAVHRSCVQIPGRALRMSSSDFADAMARCPSILHHMLRYVQSFIVQSSQTALCNAKHATEQKIARWLLLAQDLSGSDFLPVTHDQLAMLLNARRASVSAVLAKLELDGFVSRSRGVLFVRDRDLVQRRTCSCYKIIRESTSWLCSIDHGDPARRVNE